MQDTETLVREWLDTFSTVEEMRGKPEALAKEMAAIIGVFSRDNSSGAEIDATFEHIKLTCHSRAWPTVAQCYDALRHVKRAATGERVVADEGGDRYALSGSYLSLLENQVIPTARRWLRMFPGLRGHAVQTLKYWKEPLVDDNGRNWEKETAR